MGVEDIRHAVNEDPSRFAPVKWLLEPRLPESRGERVGSIRRRVLDGNPAEISVPYFRLRKGEGVAVIAPLGDLRTAGHGVPRGVGPLDAGFQTHRDLPWESGTSTPNIYRSSLGSQCSTTDYGQRRCLLRGLN